MMASAKISDGIASMTLVRPLTTSSHQPRKYPADIPRPTPMRSETVAPKTPMKSETRPP